MSSKIIVARAVEKTRCSVHEKKKPQTMASQALWIIFHVVLPLVQLTLARFENGIESFPSCVEVTAVKPPPYSVVGTNYWFGFELTFSKPVKKSSVHYHGVTLSSSPRGYIGGGRRSRQGIAPVVIRARHLEATARLSKWKSVFHLKGRNDGPVFRIFYLIIEGAYFFTYDSSLRKIFVPQTSLGPYFIDQLEKEYHGNHSVQPLSPSPYCQPRTLRGRATTGSSFSEEKFVEIQIPRRGHTMSADDPNTVQLLALVNVTEGKGTAGLPPSVIANISGVEYDVSLPAWNLTFDLPATKWNADFTQKMVLEPNERIYHSLAPAYALHSHSLPPHLKWHRPRLVQPYFVWVEKGEQNGVEVFAWQDGPKLMEFQKKIASGKWYERVRSGKFYYKPVHGRALPNPDSRDVISREFSTTAKRCPVDSPRNPGRQGHAHHVVEFGAFYQLVEVAGADRWWIQHTRSGKDSSHKLLTATTSKGEERDLRKKAQFGWKNKGISSRVVKALTEDYVCLQTRNTFDYWNKLSLESECIFVPRETAYSRYCGGLLLQENLDSILSVQNFCQQELGNCIGESFYSTERFPVIPPFGLPELTGSLGSWKSDNNKYVRILYGYLSSPLYQLDVHHIPITGAKILFPRVEFKRNRFCGTVWKLESEGTLPLASLSAHIHNTGDGGGVFDFDLHCSSELQVFPSPHSSVTIGKRSRAVVRFRISGSQVLHKPVARHKCRMSVAVRSAKELVGKVQQFPNCTRKITTYHGLFKNPCTLKGKGLPRVDMKYYNLPVDQMEPLTRDKHVHNRANLPNERKLHLVKAITISLGVQGHQHHLIANLKQLHVHCGHGDVLVTRSYGEFLVHQAVVELSGSEPPRPSLVFSGEDFNLNSVYFFMPRRSPDSTEAPVYTDCWAELWANRPHPLCNNPILVAYMAIPLRDHDQAVYEGEEDSLAVLYGTTSEGVRVLLMTCVVATVVLCVFGGIMHSILLIVRRRLPQTSTLKKYRKDLEKVKQEDTEYWENPQMFLTSGSHGPFYKLHSFRATCPLDTENLKSLKIAGTLRYESKELQVLFGHVKKVFVEKATKSVWVQASSGMYQLCPEQASPDYREEYTALMKRNGVKIKPLDFEPVEPHPSDHTSL